jgi:hypothetical protein
MQLYPTGDLCADSMSSGADPVRLADSRWSVGNPAVNQRVLADTPTTGEAVVCKNSLVNCDMPNVPVKAAAGDALQVEKARSTDKSYGLPPKSC